MKTHWVPIGGDKLPLIQGDDWRFHVPLRPVFAAFGVVWASQYRRLFERTSRVKIATHNVQDGDEFTPMTTTPLTRLGWWLRSIPGLRQNKDGWDEVDDLAERILSAFDAAVSAIMSGSEPGGPYIERGQAIRIAELEQRLEHAGQLRRQRNRMPRVPITAKERLEWVAKHAAGKSYAEIGDEAGRHPAVVRRIILEGKE